eukprot:7440917-Pyramimonas_sp.AAC.1
MLSGPTALNHGSWQRVPKPSDEISCPSYLDHSDTSAGEVDEVWVMARATSEQLRARGKLEGGPSRPPGPKNVTCQSLAEGSALVSRRPNHLLLHSME